MTSTAKRSYSPTIDDIRQFNIKRQRILNEFEGLSLSSASASSPSSKPKPSSSKHKEYIPDIEEFLINNQDDQDILESSKHIDIDNQDSAHWIIPNSIISIPGVDSKQVEFSYDRLKSRKLFENRYNIKNHDQYITNDEILYDYEILRYWSLMKYIKSPSLYIYEHWKNWYFNDCVTHLKHDHRIEMLPDDYAGEIDLTNDIQDYDNDLMIDDDDDQNSTSYNGNPSLTDEMDID